MIAECKCHWRNSTTPCHPHSHRRDSVNSPWVCFAHEHEVRAE